MTDDDASNADEMTTLARHLEQTQSAHTGTPPGANQYIILSAFASCLMHQRRATSELVLLVHRDGIKGRQMLLPKRA